VYASQPYCYNYAIAPWGSRAWHVSTQIHDVYR